MIKQATVKQSDIDPTKAKLIHEVVLLECARFGTCLLHYDEIALRAGDGVSSGMVSHGIGYLTDRGIVDVRQSEIEDFRKTGARREIFVRTLFTEKKTRLSGTFFVPFPYLHGDPNLLADRHVEELYTFLRDRSVNNRMNSSLEELRIESRLSRPMIWKGINVLVTHGILKVLNFGYGNPYAVAEPDKRFRNPALELLLVGSYSQPVIRHIYGEKSNEDLPLFSEAEKMQNKLRRESATGTPVDMTGVFGGVGRDFSSPVSLEVAADEGFEFGPVESEEWVDPWRSELVTGTNELIQRVGVEAYILRRVIRSLVGGYGQALEDGKIWVKGNGDFANFGALFNHLHSTERAKFLTKLLEADLVKFTYTNGSFWYRLNNPEGD